MGALEASAFTTGVTAFVPGGAAIAGLVGVIQTLQGPGEPAFLLEFDPWGRESVGYGLAPTTERRQARIGVSLVRPGNAIGANFYNPEPPNSPTAHFPAALSGGYNGALAPASGTYESPDLSKLRQEIHRAGVRRGDPFRLGGSAVLGNVGTAWNPRYLRAEVEWAEHTWPGALMPVHVSFLQSFGAELTARQDALAEDAAPSFWWIDRRSWEDGGARQTWEESVYLAPVAGYGTPGGTPVVSLGQWTAGTTTEAQAARAEWEARQLEQLEQYDLERERWREWKAARAYELQLAEQLEQLEQAALQAYQSGIIEAEANANAAGAYAIETLPTLPVAPTSLVASGAEQSDNNTPAATSSPSTSSTARTSPPLVALGALAAFLLSK